MTNNQSQTIKLTPMEQAMNWERMSGERLSDADRQHVIDGGGFTPPHMKTTAKEPVFVPSTKREIARAYRRGDIGISDAVPMLRDDYDMTNGEALRYLGL